tara:strand:+ start:1424 stop:1687 length:264 start_codon:yes stop_codon:yes gene_type:complete
MKLKQYFLGGNMKNETYDIVIKCDTEEQRDLVLEKVDELKNKPCGSVWYDSEGYRNGTRVGITNVFFKESDMLARDGLGSNREREVC